MNCKPKHLEFNFQSSLGFSLDYLIHGFDRVGDANYFKARLSFGKRLGCHICVEGNERKSILREYLFLEQSFQGLFKRLLFRITVPL